MKEIKIIFNNNGKIVGKLHKKQNPKGLIILVHGFTGSIEGPGGTSWIKLAKLLAKENFDVFRFNFCFTSPGWKEFHKMTIASEVSDLKLILKKFSTKYRKIGIVGESLGGAVSILAFNKKINCLVLWYPIIDYRGTDIPKRFGSPSALAELKEKGYVTMVKRSTAEHVKVGKKYIMAIKKLNLYKKLRTVSCPTLIVSPDKDTVVPFWQSVKTLKLIKSEKKKLYKIKNSDHAWWKPGREKRDWAAESLAIKQTVNWLKSNI